ncbi:MAG: isocitrate lyase/phosphoenolpyruvate mutase family protein [Alphaproteobacteria bacterium]|nr:isocitrate lyase/phosphoenolpyruvate mutase family protein [Alphaproteobacteria bacterium]
MTDQLSKANTFMALHERQEPMLIPNPWDAGSAKLLASLGFEALATTSAGACFTQGTTTADADLILENCRAICEATDLPVTIDSENCFADDPAEAAKMIPLSYEAGAVGGSIEDATGDRDNPVYEFSLAVDRVQAAVEAARALPVPFVLTARADGLLFGGGDIDDIIRRLQAFEEVGADVLYPPRVQTIEEMKIVMDAVSKPVNIVMGLADPTITLPQLAEIGVRRISIGAGLSRVALNAFMRAAQEMKDGRFGFINDMISFGDVKRGFGEGGGRKRFGE